MHYLIEYLLCGLFIYLSGACLYSKTTFFRHLVYLFGYVFGWPVFLFFNLRSMNSHS